MSTTAAKIQELEDEIARTQKNKATEKHIGLLKAKIAQLKREQLEATMKGKSGGQGGFDIRRSGDVSIGLIGMPSVGKSSFISTVTSVESKVAATDFTTLTAISGVMHLHGARVQVIDLPGIVEGAAQGRGGGRQVIAAARASDLLLVVLDATKPITVKHLILSELESAGIRVNREPRDIVVQRTDKGGISVQILRDCPNLDEEVIRAVLKDFKLINASIRIRDADCDIDDVIDAIQAFLGSPRLYIPAIFVLNKCDALSLEEFELLSTLPNVFCLSVTRGWGLEDLKEAIWNRLNLIRVYTKSGTDPIPDLEEPVMLPRSRATVGDLCKSVHNTLFENFDHAIVWGRSAKFPGQSVGIHHQLVDEDVVQIFVKKQRICTEQHCRGEVGRQNCCSFSSRIMAYEGMGYSTRRSGDQLFIAEMRAEIQRLSRLLDGPPQFELCLPDEVQLMAAAPARGPALSYVEQTSTSLVPPTNPLQRSNIALPIDISLNLSDDEAPRIVLVDTKNTDYPVIEPPSPQHLSDGVQPESFNGNVERIVEYAEKEPQPEDGAALVSDSCRNEVTSLRLEIRQYQAQIEELTVQKAQLVAELARTRQAADDATLPLISDLRAMTRQVTEAELSRDEALRERDRLREEIQAVKQSLDQERDACDRQTARATKAEREYAQAHDQIIELESTNTTMRGQLTQELQRSESLAAQLREIREEMRRLTDQCAQRDAELNDIRSQLHQAREDSEKLQYQSDVAERERSDLQSQLEETRRLLQSARSQLSAPSTALRQQDPLLPSGVAERPAQPAEEPAHMRFGPELTPQPAQTNSPPPAHNLPGSSLTCQANSSLDPLATPRVTAPETTTQQTDELGLMPAVIGAVAYDSSPAICPAIQESSPGGYVSSRRESNSYSQGRYDVQLGSIHEGSGLLTTYLPDSLVQTNSVPDPLAVSFSHPTYSQVAESDIQNMMRQLNMQAMDAERALRSDAGRARATSDLVPSPQRADNARPERGTTESPRRGGRRAPHSQQQSRPHLDQRNIDRLVRGDSARVGTRARPASAARNRPQGRSQMFDTGRDQLLQGSRRPSPWR